MQVTLFLDLPKQVTQKVPTHKVPTHKVPTHKVPGGSGTTGLGASLRTRFRGVRKDVEMNDFMADNPAC